MRDQLSLGPAPLGNEVVRGSPGGTGDDAWSRVRAPGPGEGIAGMFKPVPAALRAHPRLASAVGYAAFLALALWSRYRYVFGEYRETFGSGDANLILLKARMLQEGILHPSAELAPSPALFDQPPLIPIILASVSTITRVPLETVPFILVPLLSAIALLAFFDLVRRTFGLPTAVLAAVLLALLPRFSFDSTEPDKSAFVVSFAMLGLWLLVKSNGRGRLLPLAGLLLGLSAFSHTTGYFFIPVFIATYIGIRGLSRRALLDRGFLAALAFPALFIGAFFVLEKAFAVETAGATAEPTSSSILPGFVRRYVDVLLALASGGFRESAWIEYFQGIRAHLTLSVSIMAVGGLLIASLAIFRARRYQLLGIVSWAVIVTICFAVQFPAASHSSRYPSYVTPALLVLAAFAAVTAARLVADVVRPRAAAATASLLLVAATVGLPAFTYATAPNPGLRDLYGGYRDVAEFVGREKLLDDGSHVLYLGWPSITRHLLEHNASYHDQLHTFGFGLRDLDTFTPDFIAAHNIRYYIDARAGNDGFASSETVLSGLQRHYRLFFLGKFERRLGNYAVLYRLEPAATPDENLADVSTLVRDHAVAVESMALAVNPRLRWTAEGGLSPWTPNGVVDLYQLQAGTGVWADNTRTFGGIRQTFDAAHLEGQPVTVVAQVRAVGSQPAHSIVLALAAEGEPPFSQVLAPIDAEPNLILLEAHVPEGVNVMRLTIASGVQDRGDLGIEHVYLLPGTVDSIRKTVIGGP